MIEESKLAKTFRKDEEKKVESRSPREISESLLISGGAQNEDEVVVQAQAVQRTTSGIISWPDVFRQKGIRNASTTRARRAGEGVLTHPYGDHSDLFRFCPVSTNS